MNCSSFVYYCWKFIFTEHTETYWGLDLFFNNKYGPMAQNHLSQHFEVFLYNKEIFQHVNISWYKEHLLKNFSYWLLLTNSEYCKIFKSEEHLQMAASKNVFMKRKKNYKITIPAFWEGNMLYIYQYVIWLAKKTTFFKKRTPNGCFLQENT